MNITIIYSFMVWVLGGLFFLRIGNWIIQFFWNQRDFANKFKNSSRRISDFIFFIFSFIFLLQYNGNYFAALGFLILFSLMIVKLLPKRIKSNNFSPLIFFIIFYSVFKILNVQVSALSYLLIAVSMDMIFVCRGWKRCLVYIFRQGHFLKSIMGPIGRFRHHHRINFNAEQASFVLLSGILKLFILLPAFRQLVPLDLMINLSFLQNIFYKGLWNYLNLYLEFSGFSEIVMGVFLFFGRACPQNFSRPYLSTSLKDFWNSWHRSLGYFIRNYIYIPLGGNRLGQSRALLNLCIAMTLCGLWHGLQWNFALWGLLQGLGLSIERLLNLDQNITFRPLRWLITQTFMTFSWALFFTSF